MHVFQLHHTRRSVVALSCAIAAAGVRPESSDTGGQYVNWAVIRQLP